ncbi:putative J domain-containing protein C17A3.05c [Hordeum vulgare]|nr:putative J domain-containing protein C17A3.05c [Hordeum vulgare]
MFDQMLIERLIQEQVAEEVPGAAAQLFDSKMVLDQVVIERLIQEQVAEEVPDAVAQLFDSKTVFDQMVIQRLTQEQATDEEENRRWKQQAMASATCSCCFLGFLESLECVLERFLEKLSQAKVKSKQDKLPQAKGKLPWSKLKNKALFDNLDGMPRYYAKIKGFDASNFKVHLTWLERIAMNEAEEKWSDEELPVACGSFSLGKTDISQDRLIFSHIVSWKANGGNMKYIPVRVRIESFVSLFATVKEKSDIVVAPSELLRFSHSVPFYRTNGNEKVATSMPSGRTPMSRPQSICDSDELLVPDGSGAKMPIEDKQDIEGSFAEGSLTSKRNILKHVLVKTTDLED